MAQKKGGGSTRNGRDSKPKMLGVKAFGGELISAGSIVVANVVPSFTPASMSVWARTIRCLRWWTDTYRSALRVHSTSTWSM